MASPGGFYRHTLEVGTSLHVRWELRGGRMVDYSVVLLHEPPGSGSQRAVRVYDYAHGFNEEHPCDQQGNRLSGRPFHQGGIQEGFEEAKRLIRAEYVTMVERWLASP